MIKTFLEARLCSFLQMAGYIRGEKVIFLKSHIYLNFIGETFCEYFALYLKTPRKH